jgi:hypothetical protein
MDREDFTVDAVPDGWHVAGFLNTVTGAKLKKVLDSVSAPHDKDDNRTGAERRVQGLDDLMTSILEGDLPADKGVRPHMSVFVDADTVAAAAEHVQQATEEPHLVPDPMPTDVEPATLAGHGTIGPNLLMYLLCVSDLTSFVMQHRPGTQDQVPLKGEHGPSEARQGAWAEPSSDGVAEAASAASRAPHLVHRGLLHVGGNAVDGFTFSDTSGQRLPRRRRTDYHRAA